MNKQLDTGEYIPSRIYYYLLDFNDSDGWATMRFLFNEVKLHKLSKKQIMELFVHVTVEDLKLLYV